MGDELIFVNKETGEEFGEAKITDMKIKTLGTLDSSDMQEHEYASEDEMYENFRKHYGDRVNKDSELKIIFFEFLK